jgi:hypothetical protein
VARSIDAERTALCREGAQTLLLTVPDPSSAWNADFSASAGVSGTFYSVQEAALLDVSGLSRTYVAIDDQLLTDLGRGTVSLRASAALGATATGACEAGVGSVRGTLSFPDAGLSGRFSAQACPCTDGSTFRVLANCITFRCERAEGAGCP